MRQFAVEPLEIDSQTRMMRDMRSMAGIRDAIEVEIKRLTAELAKLESMLRQLDGDPDRPARTTASSKAAGTKKRLRLKHDVETNISQAIVKAVKAHKDGASRANIVEYLGRSGWKVGHHFNDPHLNKLVSTLIGGEAPAIRREGTKGNARYHAI